MRGFETGWRLEGWVEGGAENQDRVGICEEPNALVFVIADGEGDNPAGGVASRRAVEIVRKAITGERPNDDPQVWVERLAGIDRMLSRDRQAGETTALVASIVPPYGNGRTRRIVGASVGTSEAWRIGQAGDHRIERLTTEQTTAPLLGSGSAQPRPFDVEWTEGTLLLATDGLFRFADQERIAALALETDIEQAAEHLLALPRLPDGKQQDDVAVLLCRCTAHNGERSGGSGFLDTLRNLWNWGQEGRRR